MSNATISAPRPRRLRTITPPPPVMDWTREMALLEEAGPELAVTFWRVLRKVRAWAETPQEDRAALFQIDKREACERLGRACGLAPVLVEAFGTFSTLVRAPGRVEPRQLAEACHQVHEWAEERSLVEVAMLFAEAAASADPDDPAWANDAGRLCRRAAQDERASSWYHRGYGLGARFDAPEEVIRAQIGYGNLMKDLGQHDEAKKFLERAARRAIYTGRKRQAGEAHHDLLAIAAEVGTYAEAERHVRRALNLYPLNHPRLPALTHDWAFLLVRLHLYTPAIPLLEVAVARAQSPELRALFQSTFAWAAAGAGQVEEFDRAERIVLQLVQSHQEFASAALLHLAEGARVFALWERATSHAANAVDFARSRKAAALEREGLELIDKIAAREASPPEESSLIYDRLNALAFRFEARLRKWDAPGRKQPGADPNNGEYPLSAM